MNPISKSASLAVRYRYDWAEQYAVDDVVDMAKAMAEEASAKQDWSQGIDTVMPGFGAARRVRNLDSSRGKVDFSLRYRTQKNISSEWSKMLGGSFKAKVYSHRWVNDWMVFGFRSTRYWALIDVGVFRECYFDFHYDEKKNADGSVGRYWRLDDIPDAIIARVEYPLVLPPKPASCRLCWQEPEKWVRKDGRVSCKVCGKFIGYERR